MVAGRSQNIGVEEGIVEEDEEEAVGVVVGVLRLGMLMVIAFVRSMIVWTTW